MFASRGVASAGARLWRKAGFGADGFDRSGWGVRWLLVDVGLVCIGCAFFGPRDYVGVRRLVGYLV